MSRSRLEMLDDYASGHMADAEAEGFEEALFESAADGDLLFLDRLARFGPRMVATRTFGMPFVRADVEALVAEGYRVAFLDLGDAGSCRVPPVVDDVDLVVTRVRLPDTVDALDTVDVELEVPGSGFVKTIRDVRVDRADNSVYACCDVNLFRLVQANPHIRSRYVTTRAGKREVIAEHEAFLEPDASR